MHITTHEALLAMKIYLIGMPGSGKTTLGKKLASKLMLEFVDLDEEIEKREQKAIPEIFSQQGEDYFRLVESTLLHEWAASSKTFVMSTGGGAPCFHKGIEVINNTGISIFLDVSVAKLAKRVAEQTNRPLLHAQGNDELIEKLQKLRLSRIPFYQQARFSVTNPITVKSLLDKFELKR